MDEWLACALNAAELAGATYADVRIVELRSQVIEMRQRAVTRLSEVADLGLGVRALCDGGWGFAATPELEPERIAECAREAVRIARASARTRLSPIALSALAPASGSWETPVAIEPFDVPVADKLALLDEASVLMLREPGVQVAVGHLECHEERKHFASSDGARVTQRIVHTGAGIVATAIGQGDVQVRSYPTSFGGEFEACGYELVEELDLVGHAAETAAMAAALLTAAPCPAGERDIILDGSQVSLQIHESCGHPAELDRVLGHEANFAGTSFLTPDQLGVLQYGSPIVHLVADATAARGLGTFGFDDEGVPAQRADLVRAGRLVGYLTSRETAPLVGQVSNGTMRAASWSHLPLIRMTNINLEPGERSLEQILAETEDGIHMLTNRSWSIDDRRYNFQFGTEVGWEIRHGRRVRLLKNCTYTGITPEFWNRCDAIANAADWRIWGTPNCGKGQPGQTMRTSQGAASARFRGVRVGVGGGA